MNEFPLVSVLFITFRRFHLLQRTVQTFLSNSRYPKLELVIADDGSPPEVQRALRSLPVQRVVASAANRGLGANMNAGLRACTGKYILSLQDDWECNGPSDYLLNAVAAIEASPAIGLIRFYGIDESMNHTREAAFPGLRELEFPPTITDANRYLYSDTPHLKSRELCEALGEYREDLRMEDCEREYAERFLRQRRFVAAYFPQYMNSVFIHIGAAESFRTNTAAARLEHTLYPLAGPLKRALGPAYPRLRSSYRAAARLLLNLRWMR